MILINSTFHKFFNYRRGHAAPSIAHVTPTYYPDDGVRRSVIETSRKQRCGKWKLPSSLATKQVKVRRKACFKCKLLMYLQGNNSCLEAYVYVYRPRRSAEKGVGLVVTKRRLSLLSADTRALLAVLDKLESVLKGRREDLRFLRQSLASPDFGTLMNVKFHFSPSLVRT